MEIETYIDILKKGDLLTEEEIRNLCFMAKCLLCTESNLLTLNPPIIICGDIHGQFYDLLHLFEVGGDMPEKQYLFLGDFVDRGIYSIETISYLLCLKVKFPTRIHLLRGNHETRMITQDYGFYDECLQKYGNANVWNYFMDVFDYFSVSAVIANKVYCVHGGLSPFLRTLDQIRFCIDRNQEVPHEGPFCDILWSDPDEHEENMKMSSRGAGFLFGKKPVDEFCQINGLNLIARAHQLVMEGYKYHFDKKLVTVWSAPNYCGRCNNIASIMKMENETDEAEFVIFDAVDENDDRKVPKRIVASMFN